MTSKFVYGDRIEIINYSDRPMPRGRIISECTHSSKYNVIIDGFDYTFRVPTEYLRPLNELDLFIEAINEANDKSKADHD